jgi:hypothetical protein
MRACTRSPSTPQTKARSEPGPEWTVPGPPLGIGDRMDLRLHRTGAENRPAPPSANMEQEQRTEGHAPDACPVAGLGLPLATAARLEIGAVTWRATAARVTQSSWHARRRHWSCGCCAGCWRADSWTATTGIALLAPTCPPLSPPPSPFTRRLGPNVPAGLCSERAKCCRRLGRATLEKERGPSSRCVASAPTLAA